MPLEVELSFSTVQVLSDMKEEKVGLLRGTSGRLRQPMNLFMDLLFFQ